MSISGGMMLIQTTLLAQCDKGYKLFTKTFTMYFHLPECMCLFNTTNQFYTAHNDSHTLQIRKHATTSIKTCRPLCKQNNIQRVPNDCTKISTFTGLTLQGGKCGEPMH